MDFIGMHLVLDAGLQSNGTVLKYPYLSGQSDPIRGNPPDFLQFPQKQGQGFPCMCGQSLARIGNIVVRGSVR